MPCPVCEGSGNLLDDDCPLCDASYTITKSQNDDIRIPTATELVHDSENHGEQNTGALPWLADKDYPEESIENFASKQAKKKQHRREKNERRKAYQSSNIKERKALLVVLQSLPAFVPGLSSSLEKLLASMDLGTVGENRKDVAMALEHDALNCFDFDAAVSMVEHYFRAEVPYRCLPNIFGPTEATLLLSGIIDRNKKFDEKNLPQEMSLVTKLWTLSRGVEHMTGSNGRRKLAVVDIGAGNGCLALLAAIVLDAHAVLIDHTLPHEELRVECKVPEPYRSRVLRINGDVRDLDLRRDLEPLLAQYGITSAVVVAKHLCGVGTDLALDLIGRWRGLNQEVLDVDAPSIASIGKINLLGAAFATCCCHKIGTDIGTYARLNQKDSFLQDIACNDADRLHGFLNLCTPCVSWRTTANALGNRVMPEQIRAAELFEDVFQRPRLKKLKQLFPEAVEVAFVPATQSAQNRCILAGSTKGIQLALDLTAEATILTAVRAACDQVLSATAGVPLDLRPKGVFSSKFREDDCQ